MHEIQFQFTAGEMFRLMLRRKLLRPWLVAGFAACAAGAWLLMRGGGPDRRMGAAFLAVDAMVLAALVARLWIAARGSPMVRAPATLRFDGETVTLETFEMRATYGWALFGRRWARGGLALLEIGRSRVVLPVPRRAFDAEGWRRFAEAAGLP